MDARKVLVAQLLATRDTLYATAGQIDASLVALGVDVDALAAPDDTGCSHPDEQIINHHATMDDAPDDWECRACGARQPDPFHPED